MLLPDGSKEIYKFQDGQVNKISSQQTEILMPVKEDLNGISVEIIGLSMYICAGFIVLFMTIDDLVGIKPSIRLLFQALIILLMIMMSDEYISNLGNLFGLGDIELGRFSIPFTIFCVVGLMNAFNMIDGINGLCAGCAMLRLFLYGFIQDSYTNVINVNGR